MIRFFERLLFYVGHALLRPMVLVYVFSLRRNDLRSKEDLEEMQVRSMVQYLEYCRTRSQYFRRLFERPLEFDTLLELQLFLNTIPVMSKEDIKASSESFMDSGLSTRKWKWGQTGGSTGEPLKYRLSRSCNDMASATLYRGWSRGGYKLGDRVAVLAGGSLVSKHRGLKARLVSRMLNFRKYSSYGVSDEMFLLYYRDMKSWSPDFLRGYVSSIFEFAKYVEENGLELTFKGIFTTAEMLSLPERRYIERVFSTRVYNTYGLNDGGISAYECCCGSMHVDVERAYLEVVDDKGIAIDNGVGRILATSFLNEATFFVRYDTGDYGELGRELCECGSSYPVLRSLKGRKTDGLRINDCFIGSPVLTVLMSGTSVNRYQFIQTGNSILVVLDVGLKGRVAEDERVIRDSLFSQVGEFDLNFTYDVSLFHKAPSGKHKVVVFRES